MPHFCCYFESIRRGERMLVSSLGIILLIIIFTPPSAFCNGLDICASGKFMIKSARAYRVHRDLIQSAATCDLTEHVLIGAGNCCSQKTMMLDHSRSEVFTTLFRVFNEELGVHAMRFHK